MQLIIILATFLLCLLLLSCSTKPADRASIARKEKLPYLHQLFKNHEIAVDSYDIYLRAFKKERVLEIWAKNKQERQFKKLADYDICTFSGDLGPKRRSGDKQIPEGIYHIDRFNPQSKFHLSLGISYPNQSDRLLGEAGNLGGDIFIHGDCVSIGCLAMTDDKIKEIYTIADGARRSGQKRIRVDIYPMRFDGSQEYDKAYIKYTPLWEALKGIYLDFEGSREAREVEIDEAGRYRPW